MSNAIVSIVYGDDLTYYQGAKFSLLSFLANCPENGQPNVYVLTEKPDFFSDLPFTVFPISREQKADWTCDGKYHFRIKNRGLKYIIGVIPESVDKFLFFDADTHFKPTSAALFEMISAEKAVLFYPETNIYNVNESSEYGKLKGKEITLSDGGLYSLTPSSTMWNSGVIGVSRSMMSNIDYADNLILGMMELDCQAHTIEQFALSEALVRDFQLSPAREYVNDYSTSGQKNWARIVLQRFFEENGDKPFEEQVELAKTLSFRRPLSEVIKGHIYKKKKKLRKLFGLPEE
ncbi:hypothetical protein [Vibrio mexicanus]|uniref:hypothetical protein n=1 Tax=Vibrio mexicanus TaxID=1004326 RepID=UPI00063C2B8F|nr:hypothetical protein [Vibrio mexicanus]